jgi:hypothetical protein
MIRVGIPVMKESQGLVQTDGKWPDGLALVPWHSGRSATWDVTVVDRLAASCITQSATNAASAVEAAALRQTAKYSMLSHSYHFYPVAI